MRVRYRSSPNLPSDVAAALVEGECESVILIAEDATGAELAPLLDSLIGEQWVPTSWIFVGRCDDRPLRAVR